MRTVRDENAEPEAAKSLMRKPFSVYGTALALYPCAQKMVAEAVAISTSDHQTSKPEEAKKVEEDSRRIRSTEYNKNDNPPQPRCW